MTESMGEFLNTRREVLQRERILRRMLGDGGLAGRSALPAPVERTGSFLSQAPIAMPEPLTRGGDVIGSAHLLAMSVTGTSVDPGGAYVTWDGLLAQQGFEDVSAAGESWVHPITATYVLAYEQTWLGYSAGGSVELELDNVTSLANVIVEDAAAASRGDGTLTWFGTLIYFAEAGAVGKIKVTHAAGATEDLTARVQIGVSDPLGRATLAGNWTKVTDADVYELDFDGTNWWTTEGQSGVTVSKRDAAWAQLASFEALALSDGSTHRVRGIAHVSTTEIWLSGAEDVLASYTEAGALNSSFPLADEAHNGVVHDGTDVWVVEGAKRRLYRYSTAGSLLQTIGLPSGHLYFGLALFAGDFFVLDDSAQIIRIDTTGTVLDTIDATGVGATLTGVYIAADGTLYVAADGVGVFQRDEVVT